MPAGRPLTFESAEQLEEAIERYFAEDAYIGEGEDRTYAPTMAGLALSCGVDRKTITNYSNKDEFFPTIKKARARIEAHLETRLYGSAVTGVIFNLKNNFDWKDKQDVTQDITSGGKPLNTWVVNPVTTNKDG